MFIINIVWPVTALYAGPLGLLAWLFVGKRTRSLHRPFWQSMVIGTLHCGAGCTLGDLLSQLICLRMPVIIAGRRLLGGWSLDIVMAFIAGILFRYYAIRPMRKIGRGKAILTALKADSLSLIFWQTGMYGWMAISIFLLFHRALEQPDPVFWLMMQLAMLVGFVTALPVNWWLLKRGIKTAM